MNIVASAASIQKIDNDLVPNFGANNGAENSQPVRLGLRSSKGVIGVFDKPALRPLHLKRPRLWDGCAVQQIVAARGVIPSNVFGRDVVVPGCRETRANRREYQPQTQPKRPPDSHEIIIPPKGLAGLMCTPPTCSGLEG